MYLIVDLVLRTSQIQFLWHPNIHNSNIIGVGLLLVLLLDYGFRLLNMI
jgi:hypothetical protein